MAWIFKKQKNTHKKNNYKKTYSYVKKLTATCMWDFFG